MISPVEWWIPLVLTNEPSFHIVLRASDDGSGVHRNLRHAASFLLRPSSNPPQKKWQSMDGKYMVNTWQIYGKYPRMIQWYINYMEYVMNMSLCHQQNVDFNHHNYIISPMIPAASKLRPMTSASAFHMLSMALWALPAAASPAASPACGAGGAEQNLGNVSKDI